MKLFELFKNPPRSIWKKIDGKLINISKEKKIKFNEKYLKQRIRIK